MVSRNAIHDKTIKRWILAQWRRNRFVMWEINIRILTHQTKCLTGQKLLKVHQEHQANIYGILPDWKEDKIYICTYMHVSLSKRENYWIDGRAGDQEMIKGEESFVDSDKYSKICKSFSIQRNSFKCSYLGKKSTWTLYLASFDIFCYHNDSLNSLLPNHPPKVIDRVG